MYPKALAGRIDQINATGIKRIGIQIAHTAKSDNLSCAVAMMIRASRTATAMRQYFSFRLISIES